MQREATVKIERRHRVWQDRAFHLVCNLVVNWALAVLTVSVMLSPFALAIGAILLIWKLLS